MVRELNGGLWYEAIEVGRPGDEAVYEDFDYCLAESQRAEGPVALLPFEEGLGLAWWRGLLVHYFHQVKYEVRSGFYKRRDHTSATCAL